MRCSPELHAAAFHQLFSFVLFGCHAVDVIQTCQACPIPWRLRLVDPRVLFPVAMNQLDTHSGRSTQSSSITAIVGIPPFCVVQLRRYPEFGTPVTAMQSVFRGLACEPGTVGREALLQRSRDFLAGRWEALPGCVFAPVTRSRPGQSCLVKWTQLLGQLVLQDLKIWGVGGAMWLEIYPADAHDAPPCPVKWTQSLGQLVLQDLGCRGRHVARNIPS